MSAIDNNICGYLVAFGFFAGGIGILLVGAAALYDSWCGWKKE